VRALNLKSERVLVLEDVPAPGPPGQGEVQVAVRALALNHIDVWGWRGMAFARRKLPIIAGAEAAGEVVAVGAGVEHRAVGDLVALYGALTCGTCPPCAGGRDNLCENVAGVYGFHLDGFGRELCNIPARLTVPAPTGLDIVAAALTPITFGTAEHMLFDNARLAAGQSVLVHAGGSGVGSAAIQLAKDAGAMVITTVGSAAKAEKALALGADHAINYREERFETVVRRLTDKKGVDVVFEHVGAETFAGSILSLRRGGHLVTCGATSGIQASLNLFQLFQQQLRLIGSFGCRMDNMRACLDKLARGALRPVVDTEIGLADFAAGVARLEARDVFGKIVVRM